MSGNSIITFDGGVEGAVFGWQVGVIFGTLEHLDKVHGLDNSGTFFGLGYRICAAFKEDFYKPGARPQASKSRRQGTGIQETGTLGKPQQPRE